MTGTRIKPMANPISLPNTFARSRETRIHPTGPVHRNNTIHHIGLPTISRRTIML
jgi:hypothetical protein